MASGFGAFCQLQHLLQMKLLNSRQSCSHGNEWLRIIKLVKRFTASLSLAFVWGSRAAFGTQILVLKREMKAFVCSLMNEFLFAYSASRASVETFQISFPIVCLRLLQ